MTHSEIEAAYQALPPMREFAGERTWCQRLDTLGKFLRLGPYEAQCLRDITRDPDDLEQFRHLHPALFDLLMAAFPATAQRVREPGA